MPSPGIDDLIRLLAKLPGLGPRSARRAALHLVRRRETLLEPLSRTMGEVARTVRACRVCGNLDTENPCALCCDDGRDRTTLCVVEEVADLWALERSASFRGAYHVLGGTLSALDGRGPEDLRIPELVARVAGGGVAEVILAMSATVEGQTTAHYVTDRLEDLPQGDRPKISRLAHGVPVGGELDYLDDGTLTTALKARRPV